MGVAIFFFILVIILIIISVIGFAQNASENENQKRPAYIRDHTWLSWSLKDGSTPAKIRDRWNQLSDTERQKICPTAYYKIGKGNSGREVVKKALERAKTELIPNINM